jgi:hypothetical protein
MACAQEAASQKPLSDREKLLLDRIEKLEPPYKRRRTSAAGPATDSRFPASQPARR